MYSTGSRRKISTALIALLVAILVLFEIVVRLLPPDRVRYTIQVSNNGGPVATTKGVITNPALIARWRAAMTAHPNGNLINDILLPAITKQQGNCAPLGSYSATYHFTWHGLPIEDVYPAPTVGCSGSSILWSGGLPDLRLYIVPMLVRLE